MLSRGSMNRSAVTPTKVHEKKIKKTFKKLLTNLLPYGILYIEDILNEASFLKLHITVFNFDYGCFVMPKIAPCNIYCTKLKLSKA